MASNGYDNEKTFTKKDFALALKESLPDDTDIGFALYTGKVKNWLNFLEKQTVKQIIERIEKFPIEDLLPWSDKLPDELKIKV